MPATVPDFPKLVTWLLWVLHRDMVPLALARQYAKAEKLPYRGAATEDRWSEIQITVQAEGPREFVVENVDGTVLKRFPVEGDWSMEKIREANRQANEYAESLGLVWETFGGANVFDPRSLCWWSSRVRGEPVVMDWDAVARSAFLSF